MRYTPLLSVDNQSAKAYDDNDDPAWVILPSPCGINVTVYERKKGSEEIEKITEFFILLSLSPEAVLAVYLC